MLRVPGAPRVVATGGVPALGGGVAPVVGRWSLVAGGEVTVVVLVAGGVGGGTNS